MTTHPSHPTLSHRMGDKKEKKEPKTPKTPKTPKSEKKHKESSPADDGEGHPGAAPPPSLAASRATDVIALQISQSRPLSAHI